MKKIIAILTSLAMLLSLSAMLAACGDESTPTTAPATTTPAHTHTFGTEWKSDAENHWNECSCGEKSNSAAHTDTDVDGKCDICEAEVAIPEHQHNFANGWRSDETNHWNECECGAKDNEAAHADTDVNGKCDTCEYEMEIPDPQPHEHSFGAEWASDETDHWNECECGEKTNKAAHDDADVNGKCDICEAEVAIPEHQHNFANGWRSDETNHWNQCECGEKTNEAAHVNTDTDGKCDVCEYVMEETEAPATDLAIGDNAIAGENITFAYTAGENGTLTIKIVKSNSTPRDIMEVSYSINGAEAVTVALNTDTAIALTAGDKLVITVVTNCQANMTAAWEVAANDLVIGDNAIAGENITFAYTAGENGTLTIKVIKSNSTPRDIMEVSYSINGAEAVTVALNTDTAIALTAGDKLVITVVTNCQANMTAAWEATGAIETPTVPTGDPLVEGNNVFGVAVGGGENTFIYTATEEVTLKLTLRQYGMQSSSMVMGANYSINGSDPIDLVKNQAVELVLVPGDVVVVYAHSTRQGNVFAEITKNVVTPTENVLTIGTNTISGEDITFTYTAETNGILTISLAAKSQFGVANSYLVASVSINNGDPTEIAKGATETFTLTAGDVVTIVVEADTNGTMTAAWEATGAEAPAGNTLVMGENTINKEDITYTYTATENGTLTIKAAASAFAIRDYLTVTYSIDGGDAQSVALNTDTAIALTADQTVVITIETNCSGILTASWEAGAAGNTLNMGENAINKEDITFTYTADANGKLTIKVIYNTMSIRDTISVTYTLNGQTVTVTVNTDTEIVLNAGETVVITVETNAVATLTAAWEAA